MARVLGHVQGICHRERLTHHAHCSEARFLLPANRSKNTMNWTVEEKPASRRWTSVEKAQESPTMPRYCWNQLNSQQVGAYAEYFVKMEFTRHGFQVFKPEVDDLRRSNHPFSCPKG